MTKRYKADAESTGGMLEALQASTEGRLFVGEAGDSKVQAELNASYCGLHIKRGLTFDECGWFKDHDLWIEPKVK